ncbi:MAG: sigma-70 family RNA polymerase sigma factor, partial [Gemmataceae bacterium]
MRAFEGTAQLGTWLHRITINACLMAIRTRARRPTGPLGGSPNLPDRRPEGNADRDETCRRVRAAIDQLPEQYRVVVRLRDLDGLDTAQTAARLGTNAAVVKTRLHRARHALKVLLAPERELALLP